MAACGNSGTILPIVCKGARQPPLTFLWDIPFDPHTEYLPEGFRYELRAELARVGEVIDTAETASPA